MFIQYCIKIKTELLYSKYSIMERIGSSYLRFGLL
jgi:hypothetical protein